MINAELPVDPRELVRLFRQNYVNAHTLQATAPSAVAGISLTTPQQTPILEADLSEGVRALLAEYRQNHPKIQVTLLKQQRIENGKPTQIVEDDSGLPGEDALLSLSQTVTLTTSTEVRVITEIVVASVVTA